MDKVEHFEIPADDAERATNFYMKVFGWELNPVPVLNIQDYWQSGSMTRQICRELLKWMVQSWKRTKEITTPVVTVTVGDMDNALKRIEREGGKIIVGKKEFGERGYTAYFKDTEGNVMGLWQVRARVQ